MEGKQNVFYKELRPVITVLRVVGVFPLHFHSGKATFRVLSVAMLYSLCVYATEMLLLWFTMVLRFMGIMKSYDEFNVFLFAFTATSYFLLVILIPIINWKEAGSIADYINIWSQFQVEYFKVTGRNLELSLRRQSWILTVVIAVFLTIFEIVYQLLDENDTSIDFAVAVKEWFLDYVRFFLPTFWYLTCGALSAAASGLADNFKADLAASSMPATVMQTYRGLWLLLSRLAKKTGMATYYTYGFYILYVFLTLTLSIYHTISNLTHGFRADMLLMTLECFIMAGTLFSVCYAASSATYNIGETIVDDLLDMRTGSTNRIMVQEVDAFLRTVEMRRPTIDLGGFVTINKRLFMSLGSMMVTYLIVLLQFNISSPDNSGAYNVPLEI